MVGSIKNTTTHSNVSLMKINKSWKLNCEFYLMYHTFTYHKDSLHLLVVVFFSNVIKRISSGTLGKCFILDFDASYIRIYQAINQRCC